MEMWSLTIVSSLNAAFLKIFEGLFVCGVIVISLYSFLITIGEFGLACDPLLERRFIVCTSSLWHVCGLFGCNVIVLCLTLNP
jgi:hypothetical protein